MIKSKQLRTYLLLWSTQAFSALGSGMTSYALVLWLYLRSGSALGTALLSVCSYAPYVVMSIFAGALTDRWDKRRTMLVCDLLAALSTAAVFWLIRADALRAWHLYLLNALNGLMNTIQQPARRGGGHAAGPQGLLPENQRPALVLPVPELHPDADFGYRSVRVRRDQHGDRCGSGHLRLRVPDAAAFHPDPGERRPGRARESLLTAARQGIAWLRKAPLIFTLIVYLACINLVASVYDAALPAMILSKSSGGEAVLGAVNTCVGIATLAGSLLVTVLPVPKDRVRVISLALLFSMSSENFLLAFGKTPVVWCVGAVLGWLFIPLMNANLDVIFRSSVPLEMQGRVYSCRNTLQFFTIPIGFLMGGLLVDRVFEPLMAAQAPGSPLVSLFGGGKGSGAAMLFAIIGAAGVVICLLFNRRLQTYNWIEDPISH